ncbi:alkaline phosphatase family protein [Nocardioides jiangxiensis]|uniref:Alkaline phosphatase family protein n=1 Tax=Nocardioides jiangxiensis TaxID=3064524 RepID=A0ABT9AYN4_9ACTN|nr:alkaline phosphatase family protein [Nocardioides sp. WY-20]MDO7867458.1 alkaline phosphatase family protein [Nocardioides sp. WY-20]
MTGVNLGTAGRGLGRRAAVVLACAAALVLVLAGLLALRTGTPGAATPPDHAVKAGDSVYALGATRWRMATFNVLGSGHTDGPGADTPGYPDAMTRMGNTVTIIGREHLSVVGFQEMRLDQYDEFNRLTGTGWDVWPDRPTNTTVFAQRHIANSLAWRTNTWTAIRKDVQQQRYINDDSTVNYPVVWLRNNVTGQVVIVANFHNVSDKFDSQITGGAEARRKEELAAEVKLANDLHAAHPDTPILFTGDFNEREETFCTLVGQTQLRAANGGVAGRSSCRPPADPLPVDWIFGTAPATFSGWTRLRDDLVKQTTDHPVVMSDVWVPPARAVTQPIDHVVLLSLEGVRSRTIAQLGASATGFQRLRKYAASTLNARTVERAVSISNVTSMLTGKPVKPSISGHGVVDSTTATTVHQTAGRYVTSLMSLVHDRGMSTALFTSDPRAAILDRSWNATYGAPDTTWTDNGRDKISAFHSIPKPADLSRALYRNLSGTPATFTYAQLAAADDVGHRYGFESQQYADAVVRVAKQVDAVIDVVRSNPVLRDRTLLVVAGEHGGYHKQHTRTDLLPDVQVPLYVYGPGVPGGVGLYSLNPDYQDPGGDLSGYHGPQPLRPSLVANLVTAVLGLPAIPGSTMNTQQNFNVFSAPSTTP